MRRVLSLLLLATTVALVLAPAALAHDGGEGTWGPTNDKIVTNAGFILIAFFPLVALFGSLIYHRLEHRKDERKKASKARASGAEWRGGW